MRIEFTPPPAPTQPKTSWLSVFGLAFVMLWATTLGFIMWGPGQPRLESFVSTITQHWRQPRPEAATPEAANATAPALRASLNSRTKAAAILGARHLGTSP